MEIPRHNLNPRTKMLLKNYETINPKGVSIKIQAADLDLLDIFDRSQRTTAATLSKVGDFEYYTPFQRIGSFINFSMHFKLEDIKKLESHFNYNNNILAYLQSKNPNSKLDNNKPKEDETSLFHGFMKFEYKSERIVAELKQKNRTYDPMLFLPSIVDETFNYPQNWP